MLAPKIDHTGLITSDATTPNWLHVLKYGKMLDFTDKGRGKNTDDLPICWGSGV